MTTHELFVPGRVGLIGEHSDWAGEIQRDGKDPPPGFALIVGTEQGLYARVAALSSAQIHFSSVDEAGAKYSMPPLPLAKAELHKVAQAGGFWSYIAGVAYYVMSKHPSVEESGSGFSVDNYRTTLPLQKGLSSSAAVSVLTVRAMKLLYGLKLSVEEEMEYAYQGEIVTPSGCGRMDQACAFGSVPVLVRCTPRGADVARVHLAAPLHIVIADLAGFKDTVEILATLRNSIVDTEHPQHPAMCDFLYQYNKELMMRAVESLEGGDGESLGKVLVDFQRRFDDVAGAVCPSQLTSPILHEVLEHVAATGLTWGGKGIGSQGDGSVQFLCKGPDEAQAVANVLREELDKWAVVMTVPASEDAAATGGQSAAMGLLLGTS